MTHQEHFSYWDAQNYAFRQKADPTLLRVMTANVLFSNAEKSVAYELDYRDRAHILSSAFLYFRPDVIGLQEVTPDMKAVLTEFFGDTYAFVETPTGEKLKADGWQSYRNYTPLVYDRSRFEVLDSRFHAFEHRSCWSYHWAMYASLTEPTQRFIHMNLHYYYEMNDKQLDGVEDVHRELVHLRRHFPRMPIFVTGDYNCFHTHKNYAAMVEGLDMQTGMLLAHDREADDTNYWCHDLGTTVMQVCGTAIDHITVTTDLVDVRLHRVLHDELICRSSDHCPRFLDVKCF